MIAKSNSSRSLFDIISNMAMYRSYYLMLSKMKIFKEKIEDVKISKNKFHSIEEHNSWIIRKKKCPFCEVGSEPVHKILNIKDGRLKEGLMIGISGDIPEDVFTEYAMKIMEE